MCEERREKKVLFHLMLQTKSLRSKPPEISVLNTPGTTHTKTHGSDEKKRKQGIAWSEERQDDEAVREKSVRSTSDLNTDLFMIDL